MADETNNRILLREGQNTREITQEEFNQLNEDRKVKLKKEDDGAYRKLQLFQEVS